MAHDPGRPRIRCCRELKLLRPQIRQAVNQMGVDPPPALENWQEYLAVVGGHAARRPCWPFTPAGTATWRTSEQQPSKG